MRTLFVAVSLGWIPCLEAQKCVYTADARPDQGATNAIPFSDAKKASHYLQFIVPKQKLGNTKRRILALGFAPAANAKRDLDLKITIRQTKLTSLSTDRLKNSSGFTSTMQVGVVRWPVQANTWNRIPVNYPYDPANGGLLIELFCARANASGSGDLGFRSSTGVAALHSTGWGFQPPRIGKLVNFAPKMEICFDAPFFTTFEDSSCTGSNKKNPYLSLAGSSKLGKSFDVKLENGPGSSGLAILIWGFRHLNGNGLDLTKAGAPGCVLRLRIDFVFGFAARNGAASTRVTVPNDARLISVDPLGFQWFTHDPTANSLQFVSSNWGFARLGS